MFPKTGNEDTETREGCYTLLNACIIECQKGQSSWVSRLAIIAIFAILTPLERGVENRSK